MKRKVWRIKPLHPQVQELARKYNLSSVLTQVLLNRDVAEADFSKFLDSSRADFHSPNLLPDMQTVSERIKLAVERRQKVLVFGDYDVDGITSLVIFNDYAKNFPGIFSFYIPHRVKEGYGLNKEVILRAKEEKVSLIIAFDCGTNADSEIKLAQSLGLDIVIIDHHSLKERGDLDYPLLNPKRKDSNYPFPELSTAALSFKLLQVLTGSDCDEVLDLVALSLICDVVPLTGENRILLKEGLKRLKISKRPAIRALCAVSGISQKNIDTFHVGYILGPRINAAGRMAHAQESLELFLTPDENKAYELACQLSDYNQLRKNTEAQILKEAECHIQHSFADSAAIVVCGDSWHPGVLGIVASRLADKYYKPSFVFSYDEKVAKGSGRSIESVHLMEMLKHCADSLIAYGGHRKACGIHIGKENLDNFKEKINQIIRESIDPEDFIPVLELDAELNFSEISAELAQDLESLKPYGEGNPPPQFFSSNIVKRSVPRKIGAGFSVWLSDNRKTLEGIVYDKDLLELINYADSLDIAFTLKLDNYHHIAHLVIRDCRLPGSKG